MKRYRIVSRGVVWVAGSLSVRDRPINGVTVVGRYTEFLTLPRASRDNIDFTV